MMVGGCLYKVLRGEDVDVMLSGVEMKWGV
jgi:hypothetical protein